MTIVDILIHPLTSLLIGSGITWFFAWRYYKKAGDELKAESERLYKLSHLILRWLEHNGKDMEVIRDQAGNPKSLRHFVDL